MDWDLAFTDCMLILKTSSISIKPTQDSKCICISYNSVHQTKISNTESWPVCATIFFIILYIYLIYRSINSNNEIYIIQKGLYIVNNDISTPTVTQAVEHVECNFSSINSSETLRIS